MIIQFKIIRMPFLNMPNPFIGNNHLVRNNILCNVLIFFNINFSDKMHFTVRQSVCFRFYYTTFPEKVNRFSRAGNDPPRAKNKRKIRERTCFFRGFPI